MINPPPVSGVAATDEPVPGTAVEQVSQVPASLNPTLVTQIQNHQMLRQQVEVMAEGAPFSADEKTVVLRTLYQPLRVDRATRTPARVAVLAVHVGYDGQIRVACASASASDSLVQERLHAELGLRAARDTLSHYNSRAVADAAVLPLLLRARRAYTSARNDDEPRIVEIPPDLAPPSPPRRARPSRAAASGTSPSTARASARLKRPRPSSPPAARASLAPRLQATTNVTNVTVTLRGPTIGKVISQ